MKSTPDAVACGDIFRKGKQRRAVVSLQTPHTPTAKTLHPPEPEPEPRQRKCREAQRAYAHGGGPPLRDNVLVPAA